MTDTPAIKALLDALRDNAEDLTTQAQAVEEAKAEYEAASQMLERLRTQRKGLQAAIQALRSQGAQPPLPPHHPPSDHAPSLY